MDEAGGAVGREHENLTEQFTNFWFVLNEAPLSDEVDDSVYVAYKEGYGFIDKSFRTLPGQKRDYVEHDMSYPIDVYEICEEGPEVEGRDGKAAWCVSFVSTAVLSAEALIELRDLCIAKMSEGCATHGMTSRFVDATKTQVFRVTRHSEVSFAS